VGEAGASVLFQDTISVLGKLRKENSVNGRASSPSHLVLDVSGFSHLNLRALWYLSKISDGSIVMQSGLVPQPSNSHVSRILHNYTEDIWTCERLPKLEPVAFVQMT